ncbi:MAG: ABC transporter permease [Synergistaceae bacterium]|jgi:peptide/nickel transport system permease protein|nr:ABC transporter permease [Synergistaceae bacterium]
MSRYILKRILLLIPVLLGVAVLIFTIIHMAPGDPAQTMLGANATQEEIQELRVSLGLEKPLYVQFGIFMGNTLRGDLGKSIITNDPVLGEILLRLPATCTLAFLGLLFAILIGVPLGTLAAIKQNSIVDAVCSFIALAAFSIPNFWLALMLMLLFSVMYPILPSSGMGTWKHLIIPTVVVGGQFMATIARMTRSSMLEVIRQDYIRTARAKGLPYKLVLTRHIFSNVLIPVITIAGLSFGQALGGIVITETVFSIPGTGRFLVDAIRAHDYPVVQGGVLFFAAFVGVVNLLVDMLYAFVDPRIKAQYR